MASVIAIGLLALGRLCPAFAADLCEPPEVPLWIKQFGTHGHDLGRDVAVDVTGAGGAVGSVYVTGWTLGTFSGQSSAGGWDAFLVKYSPAGDALWARQYGASLDDRGIGVAIDLFGDGAVYVAGTTLGAFPGQVFTGGGSDAYVAKFSPQGQQLWVRQFGAGNSDQAYRAAVDADGFVYVSGSTLGQFPGQPTSGDRNPFLAKYTADGDQLWVKQPGASGSANSLAVDIATGHVYLGGYTVGVFPGQTFNGEVDAFLIKYDSNGEQLWVRQFGTPNATIATDLAVDASGNIYISGHTGGEFPGEQASVPGGFDAFLAKYSPDGEQLWVRQFGASTEDRGYGVDVNTAKGVDGEIYITGHTIGVFPGQSAKGGLDVFLAVYMPDGTQVDIAQFGTAAHDYARAVAVDTSAANEDDGDRRSIGVYVVGQTFGHFPGQPLKAGQDAYLAKWPACASPPRPTVPGDLNGDGTVGVKDLLILLAAWGECADCTPGTSESCPADLSGDCSVGVADLLILLANWG